jgi:aminopeptidase N
VLLDPHSSQWLLAHVGEVRDPFLRAMLWGALWDLVRDARIAPAEFVATATRELPNESDEQLAAGVLGRLSRATSAYLSDAQRASMAAGVETMLLGVASDGKRTYGIRKSFLDTYISIATSAPALARLRAWLDSSSLAGTPLRQPTRWSIVTHLVERGAADGDGLIGTEARRDTTVNGRRSAFVAGAARPSAAIKADYFRRFFHDSTLNEDWVTASLRAFNAPDQAATTLPYLVPALDSLAWIQKNRRIFFLGSWLGGFIGGQQSPDALRSIDDFLAKHPGLPADLRQKILQTRDDLERTVKIRGRFAGVV